MPPIARIYGTHSVRRARRLIDYFEERGLIVLHADHRGLRIAAFPDLGAETLPGDPDAPDFNRKPRPSRGCGRATPSDDLSPQQPGSRLSNAGHRSHVLIA